MSLCKLHLVTASMQLLYNYIYNIYIIIYIIYI